MIVSGIDRYIVTWFDALRKAQIVVRAVTWTGQNCTGAANALPYPYYVYSISASDGVVTITFITDSTDVPNYVGSMRFTGEFGQPTVCVNAHQTITMNYPILMFQLIVVFHV